MIILPARVINFCNANGLETLDRFMDRWAELGAYGFLREKNMGKGSVEVIGTLMDSIWSADRETASAFLPLHPSEPGMTLGQSLKLLVRNMPLGVPAFLQRRLVQGLTLADSAEAAGLTRERIRQMEQVLLSDVSARLDYFPKERAKVLDALTEGRDLSELLLEGGNSPDDDLIVAAVEALFRNLPRNAAGGVPFDELGEAWLDTLTHHPQLWFGGVPLDGFLTEHVPPQHQDRFREYVADQERFRLDRVDRRVHPAQIGLRATAEALLALQPRPIPLTKLVELLERTGFHRGITREMLLQRRRQWRRALALQKKKILWNE
ncbi:MAG: hypothetical protein EOP84_18455 [Verrucomicrobiaceae bacterium]|nr:MAG: hypothetical protein EOP84_18455 [Verrucomicrobiaceae bacterium]